MPDIATAASLASALGAGGLIGQWYGGGKDRRSTRAGVLKALSEVEHARWYSDRDPQGVERLRAAIRELESASLIARVPRSVVVPYAQLAHVGWEITAEADDRRGDPEYASQTMAVSDLVRDSAETVSRAAWSSSATRWWWLRWRLWRTRREVDAITDARTRERITLARRLVR